MDESTKFQLISMKPRSDQPDERIAERLKSLSPTQRRQLKAVLRTRRKQCKDGEAPVAVAECSETESEPYVLSPAQQRMWILDQLSGHTAAYNLPSGFLLSPHVDADVLEQALRFVLRRHQALCSAFFTVDDVVWQKPRSVSTWELNCCQLQDQQAFERFFTEEVARPFNLEADWLVRASYCSWQGGIGVVLTLHHIVCDGVSIERLVLELESIYETLVAGGEPILEPIGHTYRDYVTWVHARLQSKLMKRHREYWINRFADLPEPLMLPTDFPRPVVQSFHGAVVSVCLSAQDLKQFEKLCGTKNASLFMGLVAIIQILLSRYGRHNDVVIGVPVSGRVPGDFEHTVGLMVNTVALRHTVDLSMSFYEYLQAVSASILNDLEHQEFPFDQLVEELNLERDLSRSPLFDVMVGLNDEAGHHLRLGAEPATPLLFPQHTSKVDLTFHFTRGVDQSLRLDLEYATGLFTQERITRMASHGMILLGQLVRHPQDPMAYVSMMDATEKQRVLHDFARVQTVYPRTSTLVSLFREQVKRTPVLTAVHAGEHEITYERLDERSDALAAWLLERKNIEASRVIGVMTNRSVDLIVALLAILKTGRAYMPIDPETPADRVRYMLEDAGLQWVMTGDDVGSCADWEGEVVSLSSAIQEAGSDASLPPIETCPTDLAYIMYTSGSSGRPKGVLIEQRSIVRLVRGADFHQVREHERVLQTGSMAFDASTFEIWGPLLNGGCCCLAEGKSLLDVDAFGRLVTEIPR